jgi:death-on-curing protein
MTRFLTVPQILFLHTRLIDETGGSHGLRDLGLLEAAQARPQATFEGKLLYPDLFDQAAALMHSLINNHPFLDGNKRPGITAAGLFLQLNGYQLTVGNDELESFTLKVASSRLDIAEISAWLKTFSQPIEQNPS